MRIRDGLKFGFVALFMLSIAFFHGSSLALVSSQPGWPIYTGYAGMTAPVLADFDPDYPGIETIIMYPVGFTTWDSYIYVWHQDGTGMSNWNPMIITGEAVYPGSSPAIGDIDQNGSLDIILTTHAPNVHALDRNGLYLPGWPKATGGDITATPVLADLDNNGSLEILVSSKDGSLYIWRYDGTSLNTAWPKATGRTLYYSPAVGNLDDDEELEIVLGTGSSGTVDNYVFIWNIDGTSLNASWPKTLDYRHRGHIPSLADIDWDGELEIVTGTGYHVDEGKVYAWHTDGSLVSADWPKTVSGYPFYCAVADLDLDYNGLEIVTSIRYEDKIYAWHYDGSSVSGWPYTLSGDGGNSTAIGDVDGDGSLEVVTGAFDNKMYVINADGSNETGWPLTTGGAMQVSPAISDIDYDDETEIVQPSTDGYIYMWEVGGTGRMMWPMLQFNGQHTSCTIDAVYVDDDFNSSTIGWGITCFNRIQDGVDAIAEFGDVYVFSGTYNENIIIDRNINIIGQSKDTTVIDGNVLGLPGKVDKAVYVVDSALVLISGFKIANSSYGVYVESSSNVSIVDNEIFNNNWGIYICDSTDHTEISHNLIHDNWQQAAKENPSLDFFSPLQVYPIEAAYSGGGIVLDSTTGQATVVDNRLFNNNVGIQIRVNCSDNLIYHNDFVKNIRNAFDKGGSNAWDNGYPAGGNYWLDYFGTDNFHGPFQNRAGGDGIGDTPYDISGGDHQDRFPFINPIASLK